MTKNTKIFFLVFFVSLPFWWGLNLLESGLENTFFWQITANNPHLMAAQIYQPIEFYPQKIESRSEELAINAQSAISVWFDEKGREKILFEKNSSERMPIASLTKLMTAVVALEIYSPQDITSLEELLNVMLIQSNNEAAYTLANYVSQKGFVELMNLKAEILALSNTHFANSTGIDHLDQYSTTLDLVKLTQYIFLEQPKIFEITRQEIYQDRANTNELLKKIPEIIGGKTGQTPNANGCLLLVLKTPNNHGYLINIILGSDDRFLEMENLINWLNHSYVWQ